MNQEEYVEQALISIFLQVQEHFGDAIKSYFFVRQLRQKSVSGCEEESWCANLSA
jgi:hypothetical protein